MAWAAASSVAGLSDDLDPPASWPSTSRSLSRVGRLVVDDQDAQRMVVGHLASEAVDLNGKAMRASPPPAAPFSSETVAESP